MRTFPYKGLLIRWYKEHPGIETDLFHHLNNCLWETTPRECLLLKRALENNIKGNHSAHMESSGLEFDIQPCTSSQCHWRQVELLISQTKWPLGARMAKWKGQTRATSTKNPMGCQVPSLVLLHEASHVILTMGHLDPCPRPHYV